MIKDLFNEATSFAKGFKYPYDREGRMLNDNYEELLLRLNSLLKQEEKEILEDVLDLEMKIAGFELEQMFTYGFRAGARLVIDIYAE